jgi:DNA gyrase subunit A
MDDPDTTEATEAKESVIPVNIEDEMKKSYIDYAMSVIVGRALPDVRDGLKPVHRRILYAMNELGITSNKPHKKCARIVGEVLGKYHPHGDIAVYDALVRMVQDFSLRLPLIDGQGNFGSVDGDAAAAMRYTEARLAKVAEELLVDIGKDTVDFVPNFDDSLKEPSVLPGRFPNLLINGSSGIAVGMATNIPPHNPNEVIDAIVETIENPEVSPLGLMDLMKGPDFPTGGFIIGRRGIRDAFETGRGSIRIRAKTSFEEATKGKRQRIIITELPYQVNKARLIESIADLVRAKSIEGIADLRDESDRDGMRVVIELKGSAVQEIVLNQLLKHTQMEVTFGVINLALIDGEPKVLNLKETITEFIKHRKDVITRRTRFELAKAEKRAHILLGLKVALENIDRVIKLIKTAKSVDDARRGLVSTFSLTVEQAQAILDMKLQRLTALEREKIDQEYKDLIKEITRLKEILASMEKVLKIIKDELIELKVKYGDERRTEILDDIGEIGMEDLIAEEDMVVTVTNSGYIKKLPANTYRMQRRGGKGIIGMETKETDTVADIHVASTHDYMLFFSNRGKLYWKKVYEIPTAGRYSKGKAIVNLLELQPGERITANMPVKEFNETNYLFMATKNGTVKKTPLSAFKNPRRGGIIAIKLADDNELVRVKQTDGNQEIILGTRYGKAIHFMESDVRPMGRAARGVRGIRLRKKDEVVGMEVVEEGMTTLAVTENGYGKRTRSSDYPIHKRGGKGVINIIPSIRNGLVVGLEGVRDDNEVMLTSSDGIVIRVPVKQIPVIGRNTQGVTIMKLHEGDSVVAIAKVVVENETNGTLPHD